MDGRARSQRAGVAGIRALMDRAAKPSDVVALEGEPSTARPIRRRCRPGRRP
ncbi:hypothetical protein [Streptomyces olivaceoviridis]|uniref:hypothetical protein n=1 Tax=Streptomyces olivaceoviridis TaxID=1921 RepID=UPI0027E46B70|nr:hypothetical protein [Streptomyces olivaceoviridis]